MSVTSTVELPAQPSAGNVQESALAGAGAWAPHSETHVNLSLEADVSGGTMTLEVRMDPRWDCMVGWVQLELLSQAADRQVQFILDPAGNLRLGSGMLLVNQGVSSLNMATWVPPPQILISPVGSTLSALRVVLPNTDTEDATIHVLVYNFRKNVKNTAALSAIYGVVPHAASLH